MYVQVEIELETTPTAAHWERMRAAAFSSTNDRYSVCIAVPEGRDKTIIAEFSVKKARQMDVVDEIARPFRDEIDYQDMTIRFPRLPSYGPMPAKRFTPKQGQYLAFIYYYAKVNGRSPAQHDMQKYFQVTSAAVHRMVLELEKKELISRVPRQPRSIKLLLSRAEIPDLD